MTSLRDSDQGVRPRASAAAWGVVVLIVLLMAGVAALNMVEYVSASEIVGIQYPSGTLTWHTTQGPVLPLMGKVIRYPKRGKLEFSATKDDKGAWNVADDNRIGIQFNDGGTAKIFGSLNYAMPLSPEDLNRLHAAYPNQEALEDSLIKPAMNKTVFLTGQLMSSQESYQERRSEIVQDVEDQVQNGVYLTTSRTFDQKDPTTGEARTIRVVDIQRDARGVKMRAETGQLAAFKVQAFNFAVEDLDYETTVKKQIANQQEITMAVQTSIANAKKAQQDAITSEAQGRANSAKATSEQQTANAKLIAEADGKRQAAQKNQEAAEFDKQATILRAEGDAKARQLVMAADNALDRRLAALERINGMWADAFSKYPGQLVPSVVMGGAQGTGATATSGLAATQNFMDLMSAQAAVQLGVSIGAGKPIPAHAAVTGTK